MTDYFVNSGAGGTANGTSKTDAWLTLGAATGVGAGDRVLVSHTHAETPGSAPNYTLNGSLDNPIEIISINFTGDAYTPGASIHPTGSLDITVTGENAEYSGITLWSGDDIFLTAGDLNLTFNECEFKGLSSVNKLLIGASTGQYLIFNDCTYNFDAAAEIQVNASAGHIVFNGGSFTNAMNDMFEVLSGTRTQIIEVNGMDLSNVTNLVDPAAGTQPNFFATFTKCKLKSGYTVIDASIASQIDTRIILRECAVGTLTAAAFIEEIVERQGSSFTTTARYRTGGADDGQQANAVSQEMTALASRTQKRRVFTYFDIGVYLDSSGTSKTFKVHAAHNAVGSGTAGALQDDEFWIELLGPSEKATSDAQGERLSSKPALNVTASDLTTESGETWNGTNVGTKQSASISYTNEIEGFVKIRVHLATSSVSDVVVNVCPKIEVS